MDKMNTEVLLKVLLISSLLCQCYGRVGPKMYNKKYQKEYFGKPTNSPQHMDTLLRSEFQSHMNYHVRKLNENFAESLQNIEHEFALKLEALEKICGHVDKSVIAFQAQTSKHQTNDEGILMFDEVTLNEGDGFDPGTGRFTVPYTGTYTFVYNQQGVGLCESVEYCLVINGNHTVSCADPGEYSTHIELVMLSEGDVVSLVSLSSDPDKTCSSGEKQSNIHSFSGHLIH